MASAVESGGAFDEAALRHALGSGRVFGAGVDVFGAEPPRAGDAMADQPNTLLSPHIAALPAEWAERMAIASVQNVLDYFGRSIDPSLIINQEAVAA